MKTTLLAALVLVTALSSPALAKPRGKSHDKKPPASQETGVNHVVKRGETLFSIAEQHYGDGYQWNTLKEYNPGIDPDRLTPGDTIYVPNAKFTPVKEDDAAPAAGKGGRVSRDLPSARALLSWMPDLSSINLFGRSLNQILLVLLVWFVVHFSIQGVFVWFAAHMAFVKDVTLKKALRATLQSEALAMVCVILAFVVGLMLLYVGTTSPGRPVTSEVLTTAEDYLGSPGGIAVSGLLLVGLYGFLGIRFIPPAFGIQAGRGVMVVLLSILLPHLIGFYLLSHRIGLIN